MLKLSWYSYNSFDGSESNFSLIAFRILVLLDFHFSGLAKLPKVIEYSYPSVSLILAITVINFPLSLSLFWSKLVPPMR
jgi:hypothetical protein